MIKKLNLVCPHVSKVYFLRKYLPCQILSLYFQEKSCYFKFDFLVGMSAITN